MFIEITAQNTFSTKNVNGGISVLCTSYLVRKVWHFSLDIFGVWNKWKKNPGLFATVTFGQYKPFIAVEESIFK
jgi:hypothetical protein